MHRTYDHNHKQWDLRDAVELVHIKTALVLGIFENENTAERYVKEKKFKSPTKIVPFGTHSMVFWTDKFLTITKLHPSDTSTC